MNDKLEEDEEDEEVNDSEDLLYSTYYGIRLFHFSGSWDNVMAGVMLEETDDSFLVAIPASLSRKPEDKVVSFTGLTHVPYMRMMKSEFRAISKPPVDIEEAYIKYLQTVVDSIFPDLLELIGEERPYESEEEESVPTPTISKVDTGILVTNKGMTETDVQKKVDKAIKEGVFINMDSNKIPN